VAPAVPGGGRRAAGRVDSGGMKGTPRGRRRTPAGLSWFTVNRHARKRADGGGPAPLLPSPRLLLHAAGAALTMLIVALVTARV
jgi:hypothetical protein